MSHLGNTPAATCISYSNFLKMQSFQNQSDSSAFLNFLKILIKTQHSVVFKPKLRSVRCCCWCLNIFPLIVITALTATDTHLQHNALSDIRKDWKCLWTRFDKISTFYMLYGWQFERKILMSADPESAQYEVFIPLLVFLI